MPSKIFTHLILMLLMLPCVKAQAPQEETGYFTDPHATPFGTVCSNNYSSSVYLVNNGLPAELISAPGCGAYYSLSSDRSRIGLKLVDESGGQIPAIYDISARTLVRLSAPTSRVGQVSFSSQGRIAFTRGEDLVVVDGTTERSYPLGTYANLAPISPDGRSIVYNDNDDQLWMYRFEAGERALMSDGKLGYFNPRWSPDGSKVLYSSLNGQMKVYILETKQTFELGEGYHPSWSEDSHFIAFFRKEFQGTQLVNSDIYVAGFDGSALQRITDTPDVMEMDPSFVHGSWELVFHTYARRSFVFASVARNDAGLQKVMSRREMQLPTAEKMSIKPIYRPFAGQAITQLDIPYVHQAYDTPDWFNGDAACAPTAAIMLLAYYNILPPWPTYCSTPSPHYNNWGNYVCSQYQFKEVQYLPKANDPNGTPAWGGYGYMWSGSNSPHTRMAGYYILHGMTAVQTEATPYSIAFAEVSSGHPFTLCVMLTSAGHLVLAHGFGAEPHTFIFNDCWGDKNRGYKNYYGKNASYDWPGYNNGFQNLVSVEWCIATRYDPLVVSDTIIDDLQFSKGFSMQTALPSSMTLWKDKNAGYQGHFWYAYTRNSGATDTCVATWTPSLPEDGVYEVSAYIQSSGNATDARYKINYSGGSVTRSVNQALSHDSWVSLGSYPFTKGSAGFVHLGDQSAVAGQILAVDAVRWSRATIPLTTVQSSAAIPDGFELHQNYPNPFNPSTTIQYRVLERSHVRLFIVNVIGQTVAELVNGEQSAGWAQVVWNANVSSGLYLCKFEGVSLNDPSRRYSETKKMIVLR